MSVGTSVNVAAAAVVLLAAGVALGGGLVRRQCFRTFVPSDEMTMTWMKTSLSKSSTWEAQHAYTVGRMIGLRDEWSERRG